MIRERCLVKSSSCLCLPCPLQLPSPFPRGTHQPQFPPSPSRSAVPFNVPECHLPSHNPRALLTSLPSILPSAAFSEPLPWGPDGPMHSHVLGVDDKLFCQEFYIWRESAQKEGACDVKCAVLRPEGGENACIAGVVLRVQFL